MNNRRQIWITLGGIVLALLLLLSNARGEKGSDVAPASQKKPKLSAPALFDSLL